MGHQLPHPAGHLGRGCPRCSRAKWSPNCREGALRGGAGQWWQLEQVTELEAEGEEEGVEALIPLPDQLDSMQESCDLALPSDGAGAGDVPASLSHCSSNACARHGLPP